MRAFVVDEPRFGALRALNYSPAVERIRRSGSNSARPLRDIVKAFGPAYGTAFARLGCEPEHGVELLSQSDVFAAEPQGRVIRRDSMPHPELHLVEAGQVLVAGVGTLKENELYGRAILADGRLTGKYLSQDVMAVVFEEPHSDLALYTYAWLASPTGMSILRSTSYGTKLLRFRRDILSTTPVPIAPTKTVTQVANHVRECSAAREKYLRDFRAARSLVDAMPAMQAAHQLCAERTRRSIVWRGPFPTLSAWTFASPAGALGMLRSAWRARVSDFVEDGGIFRGGRGLRVPCQTPHGINFLSQRDAFLIRPVPQRILLTSADLVPRAGTIMVGGQGTLGEGELFGRATIVSGDGAKSAWTEHLVRIVPKQGQEAQLFSFFTTTVGFRLLRSSAVGTKLLSLRPDLLLDLPVPELPVAQARRVKQLVLSSLEARNMAEQSEAKAIRIIEEEVIPQWLA